MGYKTIVSTQRLYSAGSTIVEEGDCDLDMFILNEGKLGVFKAGELIAEIEEGGVFFGEMSEILGEPRTATVKALDDCLVTVYDGGLDRIIRDFPSIAKKLIETLAERLKHTSDRFYAFNVLPGQKAQAPGTEE